MIEVFEALGQVVVAEALKKCQNSRCEGPEGSFMIYQYTFKYVYTHISIRGCVVIFTHR